MAKVLSLKVKEDVFEEVEAITKQLKMPRNAYINEALDFYNEFNRRKKLKSKLQHESRLTRKGSMEVLAELEQLENNLPE